MSKTLQKSANEVIQALFVTPLSRTGSLSAGTAGGVVSHKAPPSATPLFNRRAPVSTVGFALFWEVGTINLLARKKGGSLVYSVVVHER